MVHCTVTSTAWDGTLMLRWPVKHYTLITLFTGHGFHNMRVNIMYLMYIHLNIYIRAHTGVFTP